MNIFRHILLNKFIQKINQSFIAAALHDLDEKELDQCVSKFNRRLTKRFSTCHIDIPKEHFNKSHNCDEHPGYEQRCIRYDSLSTDSKSGFDLISKIIPIIMLSCTHCFFYFQGRCTS